MSKDFEHISFNIKTEVYEELKKYAQGNMSFLMRKIVYEFSEKQKQN